MQPSKPEKSVLKREKSDLFLQLNHGQWQAYVIHVLQRDPAEEALKSNNMNLDQAMSKFTNIFVSLCVCRKC